LAARNALRGPLPHQKDSGHAQPFSRVCKVEQPESLAAKRRADVELLAQFAGG
jgi:hypothetical protein